MNRDNIYITHFASRASVELLFPIFAKIRGIGSNGQVIWRLPRWLDLMHRSAGK